MNNQKFSQKILLFDHIAAGKKSIYPSISYTKSDLAVARDNLKALVKIAPNLEVFLIDDIIRFSDNKDENNLPRYNELAARPPYKLMWLECNVLQLAKEGMAAKNIPFPSDVKNAVVRQGFFVSDGTDDIDLNEPYLKSIFGDIDFTKTGVVRIVDFSSFGQDEDLVVNGASFYIYNKEDGKYITGFNLPLFCTENIKNEKQIDILNHAKEKNASMIISHVVNTFNFLNSTSVGQKTIYPSPKLSKNHQRRYKTPLAKFKVLTIKTKAGEFEFSEVFSSNKRESSGEGTALHKVRGHWKHYGENNKLFGKYIRTVWVDAHERGDAQNGVILKDYILKAA